MEGSTPESRFPCGATYAMTPLAERAHLLLPGAAPLEREGTLMNDSGRIQWLQPVLPLQGSSRPDWQIVAEVMNTVGKRELDYSHVSEVLAEMNERIPAMKASHFSSWVSQG
jgi:predicted molibdopterin-dependent oxidoreductase YjgC